MHNDIELATWDDSIGTERIGQITETSKSEMESIFGTFIKHDMGVDEYEIQYYQYQAERKFKSDGRYFSVFTETVKTTELDSQTRYIVDGHKSHIGLFAAVSALII